MNSLQVIAQAIRAITQRAKDPNSEISKALASTYVGASKDSTDTFQHVSRRTQFEDTAGAKGSLINVEHYADGTGPVNPSDQNEAFGLDIHNNPGANSAVLIHQYSRAQEAMRIDNTDSAAALVIKNTFNTTRNPGGAAANTSATGDFMRFNDYAGNTIWRVLGRGEMVIKGRADYTPGVAAVVQIVGDATSDRKLLKLEPNAAQVGLEIIAGAGAAGAYPLSVIGQNYGPNFVTSTDSGVTLNVAKNGSGGGDVIKVTNKGTGNALTVFNAAGTRLARIGPNGSFITANGTAPTLSSLADGEMSIWTETSTGNLKVTSRVAGVLKTATLAVA